MFLAVSGRFQRVYVLQSCSFCICNPTRDSDECDGLRTQLVVVFVEAIIHQINQVGRIEHDPHVSCANTNKSKTVEDFLESCS